MPIARQYSVCPAKSLLICRFFLEPRPSELAPVRYKWLHVPLSRINSMPTKSSERAMSKSLFIEALLY